MKIPKGVRVRTTIPFLLLAFKIYALTDQEVIGMWTGAMQDIPELKTEMYFAADGTMETRVGGTLLGSDMKMSGIGRWTVRGDSIWGRMDGGWSQFGTDPVEEQEPDQDFSPAFAELLPGNPKGLSLTGCEEGTNLCSTQVLRFVGATRQFTLPVVGPGASIRKSNRLTLSRSRTGFLQLRMSWSGRQFDVMGREYPVPLR